MTDIRKKYKASKRKLEQMKLEHSEIYVLMINESKRITNEKNMIVIEERKKRAEIREQKRDARQEQQFISDKSFKEKHEKYKYILDEDYSMDEKNIRRIIEYLYRPDYEETPKRVIDALEKAMSSHLDIREQKILSYVCGNNEIRVAYALSITRKRVSQIVASAKSKIYRKMLEVLNAN